MLSLLMTGSANALCTNLFGVKDTFNVPLACLNVIKGKFYILL
jgi:sphingosine kinase